MTADRQFICKPRALILDKRLSPVEQDYLCLIGQLEKTDGCTASNNYFAWYFGVKRQTAQGTIGRLKTKGFITCSEKKQGGKTIERTIEIIDDNSKKLLLIDSRRNLPKVSRKPSVGLAGSSDKVSRKPPTHTIDKTIDKTNADAFRLSELLLSLILERKPDFKRPDLRQWEKHVERMIRLDKRTPERIEAVMRWCQRDSFWQANILSTAKLREKFDQLELKMKGTKQSELTTTPLFRCRDGRTPREREMAKLGAKL
jgi:hypothetical protein